MAAKQTKHDIEPGIVADLVMDMITGTRVVLEELGDVPIQNQTTCLQLVMLGIRRGAFYADIGYSRKEIERAADVLNGHIEKAIKHFTQRARQKRKSSSARGKRKTS